MTEEEYIAYFGEWFVMTKKDVLMFDALVQSTSGTAKKWQLLISLDTADKDCKESGGYTGD